jgi:hypothetical protein
MKLTPTSVNASEQVRVLHGVHAPRQGHLQAPVPRDGCPQQCQHGFGDCSLVPILEPHPAASSAATWGRAPSRRHTKSDGVLAFLGWSPAKRTGLRAGHGASHASTAIRAIESSLSAKTGGVADASLAVRPRPLSRLPRTALWLVTTFNPCGFSQSSSGGTFSPT